MIPRLGGLALAGLLTGAWGGVGPAPNPDPSGRWAATWASAVREEGGSTVVQRTSPAELVLTLNGDSLAGTWTTHIEGEETWLLVGTFRDGELRLRGDRTADGTLPGDGVARLVLVELRGRLSADGATLEGEQWLTLQLPRGTRRSAPRPWSARRGLGDPRGAGRGYPDGPEANSTGDATSPSGPSPSSSSCIATSWAPGNSRCTSGIAPSASGSTPRT